MTTKNTVTLFEILKNLGLSKEEIKIYEVCRSNHGLTISQISALTTIKRSTVYSYLDTLKELGLTFKRIVKGNTFYISKDLNQVRKIIEENEHKWKALKSDLRKIDPSLNDLKAKNTEYPTEIEVYEGLRNIWNARNKFFEILKTQRKAYLIGNTEDLDKVSERLNYRILFTQRRRQVKNSLLYQILPSSKRNRKIAEINEKDFIRIKLLPEETAFKSLIFICSDHTFLVSLIKPYTGIIVKDKKIAELMKFMWSNCWKTM